jgi:phosphoglycerate dehydrogenase-like enzyme
MNSVFRVALSGDFRKDDGSPVFRDFDLEPLFASPQVEVVYLKSESPIQRAQLEDCDALILLAHRFAKESVPTSGRLAVVARFGVGYDSVDVPACTEADIALCITPDGVRRPVAVSVMTFMLALTGKLMVKDKLTREGPAGFNTRGQHMGVGLVGRTLGSLGIGNIGAEVFRLAKPFDMRFIAHDPFVDKNVAAELGIELVSIEELFSRSDVLTINCPLSPTTHHIVGERLLSRMKPTAYLINTARGPIVDQMALTKHLQQGKIAGAGLDVFESEPPDADDQLLTLDNVILAPHALCWTDQCFAGNGAADIKAVLDVKNGLVPRGVVNRDVLDRAGFRQKLERFARQKRELPPA